MHTKKNNFIVICVYFNRNNELNEEMACNLQEFDTLEYVSNSNLIGHSLVFSF